MPLTNEEIADDIDAVHDWLLEHGWGQHFAYNDETGKYCILGAINNAVGHEGNTCVEARIEVDRALRDALGHNHGLVFWNDHPDRTEDEVFDLLRTAAKELRDLKEIRCP